MAKGLTLKSVKEELRSLGVMVKRTGWDAELRVYFPGSTPDEGHFTSDLEDARDTGRAMAAWRAGQGAQQ